MPATGLPADAGKRPAALAEATGCTGTMYAREAILEHFDDLEDLDPAKQRQAEIHAGPVRTIPPVEVTRNCGFVD